MYIDLILSVMCDIISQAWLPVFPGRCDSERFKYPSPVQAIVSQTGFVV